MTLVADGDLPDQVIASLQTVKYPIMRWHELGLPVRPDSHLMKALLSKGFRVLVTLDTGIPSQAYLYQYAANGLTVVLLRWKRRTPRDWQQMVKAVLTYGDEWETIAMKSPSVISVSNRSSRARAWTTIPPSIANSAKRLQWTESQ